MYPERSTDRRERKTGKYLAYHDRIVIFSKGNAWYSDTIKNKANNLVKTHFIP